MMSLFLGNRTNLIDKVQGRTKIGERKTFDEMVSVRHLPERNLELEPLQFRTGEREYLNSYGWIDRNAGTVHIPIADAMRMTLERGLPARAQTPPEAAQDVPPGMIPQDSSSGRTLERRRQ